MYIDTTTKEWGLTQAAIMQRHPLTVFPDPFVPLEQYAQVLDQPQPGFDGATHKAVEVVPLETEDGYLQQWMVVPLDAAELAQLEAERLAAEQAAQDAARVTVTKRQACLALFDLRGVRRADIGGAIDGISDPVKRERAQIDWEEAKDIESDSPTVLMLAAALNLSESDLVELFGYAETL